jgi:cytochrome c-type biogenesis protein CcmH
MIAAAALALAGPVRAVLPQEQLADARQEARARRLGSELRCLVCQNQTIDDSEAPLAADLRVLLRQRLRAGDTDRQAIDYIVERYGHYVLLQPPFELQTALLWLGPALVFAAGAAGVVLFVRRGRGPTPAEAPLTAEELALLARRLEQEEA